jgi:cell division septum initiation protein DivIVA
MMPTPDSAQPKYDRPPQFDLVRRGYDPRQVDEQLTALRAALEQAQRAAEAAEQHANLTETELREAREQLKAKNTEYQESSFGFRVEKILRMAEEEAREIRAQAAADAEAHRTAVEQQLAKRTHAIQEQQVRLDEEHAAAMADIRAQRSEVEQHAKALREQIRAESERLRAETTAAIARQRAEADQQLAARRNEVEAEIAQLTDVRDELRMDLKRVHDLLGEFIDRKIEGIQESSDEDDSTQQTTSAQQQKAKATT